MKRILIEHIDVLEGGTKDSDIVSVYKISLLSNGLCIKEQEAIGELERLAIIHELCMTYKIENNDYNIIHRELI